MELTEELARQIAYAIGVDRFDYNGSAPKYAAQRNLSGRTHYCDDDTLKFFDSRIIKAIPSDYDTIFSLVESLPDYTGKPD